ncbi:la-related protein 1C-like isoform X2 [Apium graveolens]|uniref:la-related protein 1C-like isoform X2 n=1 Tax=Apium graveolens TaxID=4045 RepID=UPI003D7B646F
MPADLTSSTPIHSPPNKPPMSATEPVAAVTEESSDCGNDNAGAVLKKSVWKSVNGVVEPAPVMGGASWPTITESTRGSPKFSSSSSKNLSDASVSDVQEQVMLNAPQKQATANGHPNSNYNRKQPHRQKSMKKGGSTGAGSGQSGASRPPPPPPPPPFPIPFGNVLPPAMEMPIREPAPFRGNNRDARPVGGAGSHSPRHPSRRGNFASRPVGDGGFNHSHVARHDQDRERNASRNSSGREVHMHHMVPPPPPPPPPRGLARPLLPGPIPYIPPPHMRPFGSPMPFDMIPPYLYVPPISPDSFRSVPLVLPPPPHMYFPLIDPNLRTLLLNQIDYYFSEDNLVKDDFLRSNMDDQGWVSISLIASFPRVSKLTSDVQLILDTLGASTVVEVQGDMIRKRVNWNKWIPSEVHLVKETTNKVNSTGMEVEHSGTEASGVPSPDSTITQSEPAKSENSAEASIQGCT